MDKFVVDNISADEVTDLESDEGADSSHTSPSNNPSQNLPYICHTRSYHLPQNAAKRLLVIDALNVMHMRSNGFGRVERLDSLTILPVIRYFVRRQHPVEVVVPQSYLHGKYMRNSRVWKDLCMLKLLTTVPEMMHDDLVALTIARDACGSVITKDKFRDHLTMFPHLQKVSSRNIILTYTSNFIRPAFYTSKCGDKYYRQTFECINYAPEQFYSVPGNDDYEFVKAEEWSIERSKAVLEHLDIICKAERPGQQSYESNQFSKWDGISPVVDACKKLEKVDEKQETVVGNENLGLFSCCQEIAGMQEQKKNISKKSRKKNASSFYHRQVFAEHENKKGIESSISTPEIVGTAYLEEQRKYIAPLQCNVSQVNAECSKSVPQMPGMNMGSDMAAYIYPVEGALMTLEEANRLQQFLYGKYFGKDQRGTGRGSNGSRKRFKKHRRDQVYIDRDQSNVFCNDFIEGCSRREFNESSSFDENLLSQVIGGTDTCDEHITITDYHQRNAQIDNFSRCLVQERCLCTATENEEVELIIKKLEEMGFPEEVVHKVLASSKENMDLSVLVEMCLSFL